MAGVQGSSIGFDTTFELNEFNEPKIRSEIELVRNVVVFVLMSKPGQYPSLPWIGLDIKSKLGEFFDELDVEALKTECIDQCAALGVYFNTGIIQFKKIIYHKQPSLLINIAGTETYPAGYKSDVVGDSTQYLIGITLSELNKLMYNVNVQRE